MNMLRQLWKKLGIQGDESGFEWTVDSRGLIFFVEASQFQALTRGGGNPKERLQLTLLRMLEEQGQVETIANGFRIVSEVVVSLDEQSRQILELPEPFRGEFVADVRGYTTGSDFEIKLQVRTPEGIYPFKSKGPILYLTEEECYLHSLGSLRGIEAIEDFRAYGPEERTEERRLLLIYRLQTARELGMKVDLQHFNDLHVISPESVKVAVERLPDGSLKLSPSLSEDIDIADLESRLGQLKGADDYGVVRVRDKIVVLDEERLSGVQEILSNKHIPKKSVEEFLKTPTAFLDASKVDLDSGFSVRVEGVGKLEHISIGEIRDNKPDWFDSGSRLVNMETALASSSSPEEVDELKKACEDAWNSGTEVVYWNEQHIDVSDRETVKEQLERARQRLEQQSVQKLDKPDEEEVKGKEETLAPLLRKVQTHREKLVTQARMAQRSHELDWTQFKRKPYPHQKEGVDWLSGLIEAAIHEDLTELERLQGGLLADDMGLGKTFMALASIYYYYSLQRARESTEKPILVVAPLSLLRNWESEVEQTFNASSFRDIVLLQSDRDLKHYRVRGAGRESRQLAELANQDIEAVEAKIRYALCVGPEHGISRLDLPRRLVLTTYQTLRDYEFSLARVDWGMVIFDEAQHIKNPNVLQTRAAKALKADVKLLTTGTPVENSLADFWCLMDTAQPGLFGEWQVFRDEWVRPIRSEGTDDAAKVEHGRKLREAVGPFMLRRVKEEELQDLPDKMVYSGIPETVTPGVEYRQELGQEMGGKQKQRYEDELDTYRQKASKLEDSRGLALSTLHMLRKISLHPNLVEDKLEIAQSTREARRAREVSGKMNAVLKELDQIRKLPESAGNKTILFAIDKSLQQQLKHWLDIIYDLDVYIVNGDTATTAGKRRGGEDRSRVGYIQAFEKKPGFNIIIMSPLATGTGLTVVEANHVIHVERHWNPAKEAQATDRVYRIGQQRDVHIYLPASLHPELDSFDVHMERLLASKLQLKDAVVVPESVTEMEMLNTLGLHSV
jgi:SNF2 family DNA or RNA helicase